MSATLGCEQRHWGLYLQWLSEQAQENRTQTQLPVFPQGLLKVFSVRGWRRQKGMYVLSAP